MTMRLIASSVRRRLICGSIWASGSGAFLYSEQPQQVRQHFAECRVERRKRGTDLLAPRGRIVRVLNAKIAAQQFEHRQPGRRLAVRHRVGFQHFAFGRQCRLELVDQPRLARCPPPPTTATICPCPPSPVRARASSAAISRSRPTNLRQPAPRRELEVRPQRPGAHHLVHLDRGVESL